MGVVGHAAWVQVDLGALSHNVTVIRRAVPAGARIGILVKANGYGHGLDMAARAALAGGADQLMVATLDEGFALRSAGVQAPILVVYPIPHDAVRDAVNARLQLIVSGLDSTRRMLEAWSAGPGDAVLDLHVEVDTGMGRGGVEPGALAAAVRLIDSTPATTVAGIWSHVADGSDAALSREQTRRFESALATVEATGRPIPLRHMSATDGVFAGTAPAYGMVRVGLGFYGELGLGVEPSPAQSTLAAELRPAMTVKARPMRLEFVPEGATVGYGREWTAGRRSMIATLPVGYADGWTRLYWPGASALFRGRRVPLVGRVSMDSVCADLTDALDLGEVAPDEELVLLGGQGTERITPAELARLRGSITHEVLCAFGPRLPRLYVEAPEAVTATP